MDENQNIEKKSIRKIRGDKKPFKDISKVCVGFANSRGGELLIGIEDDESTPPFNQVISDEEVERLQQRLSENCVNVAFQAFKQTAINGSDYIKVIIHPSKLTIASTSRGEYYKRTGDQTKPIVPNDLSRLLTDRPAYIW